MSHLHTGRRVTSQSTTITSKCHYEDDEEIGDESMLEVDYHLVFTINILNMLLV
jgi:hypothetical protein